MGSTSASDEIARLRDLDLSGLRARWRGVFSNEAPGHLPSTYLSRSSAIACRPIDQAISIVARDSFWTRSGSTNPALPSSPNSSPSTGSRWS